MLGVFRQPLQEATSAGGMQMSEATEFTRRVELDILSKSHSGDFVSC
jgi:hypothetical protein